MGATLRPQTLNLSSSRLENQKKPSWSKVRLSPVRVHSPMKVSRNLS
jgi:hypothetical protein